MPKQRTLTPTREMAFAVLFLTLPCFAAWQPIGHAGPGTQMVADPNAVDQLALAVKLDQKMGSRLLPLGNSKLASGLYRIDFRAKLHPPGHPRLATLLPKFSVAGGDEATALPLAWTCFNFPSGRYTTFSLTCLVVKPPLTASLSWSHSTDDLKAAPNAAPPTTTEHVDALTNDDALDDDIGAELAAIAEAETTATLAAIQEPTILLDAWRATAISADLMVQSVQPQYVHVYPQQPNPITVSVRNITDQAREVTVRLVMTAGLDERSNPMLSQLSVPAHGVARTTFQWPGSTREYGWEATASVTTPDGGEHQRSETFTVAASVWKTAIQGSGFIDWAGREEQLAAHVQRNRQRYVNVEEAFSWQPSSWTDLTPDADSWHTGQCNYHNSLKGLQHWLALSREQGIKMITYSWPTASGPAGLEFARAHPETIAHQAIGLSSEFYDTQDLELYQQTHQEPRLRNLQYSIWHGMNINRGYLAAIEMGVAEIIRSSKRFGWSGVRFDMPPTWGAMAAEQVHRELGEMGVTELMQALMPQQMAKRDGDWDHTSISLRNIKYARHRLKKEMGTSFELSYNFGHDVDPKTGGRGAGLAFYEACAAENGQIMQEAIRGFGKRSWDDYWQTVMGQADLARRHGGRHCVVAVEGFHEVAVARLYGAIFTFAGGSHPYLDYGWLRPLPGQYTRFMTRYGEWCWHPDLVPTTAHNLHVHSERPLLWQPFVRERKSASHHDVVVHLITPPSGATVAAAGVPQHAAWQDNIRIEHKAAATPKAWLLSAEPTVRSTELMVESHGTEHHIVVPSHRYWSVLVLRRGLL